MDCKEEIVDVRIPHPEEFEKGKAIMQNVFKLNQTMPYKELGLEQEQRLCLVYVLENMQ